MARRKWIDKKTATHFTLVHRPQNDPLIHDESAPPMVLNPMGKGTSKALDDLASELGSSALSIRENEGEAANYGVYYDDTEYDYMQHLRDLDSGGAGEVVFVEAPTRNQNKGKNKQSLEDALRQLDLEQTPGEIFDKEILPSKGLPPLSYQAQQDVPDAIAGFQPDMDPRLREVLEALEDDAYVDDNDDVFQELAKDAAEVTHPDDFFDDDDGWESDRTEKPTKDGEVGDEAPKLVPATDAEGSEVAPAAAADDWMNDFEKFKKDEKAGKTQAGPKSGLDSTWTTTTAGGRRKKRKGALTNPSSYSMTSASLVRTEHLSLLDKRFEKIEEDYQNGGDDMASESAISTASSVTGPVRSDFDGAMDEFLAGFTKPTKRTSKKSKNQTGLEQLDEIRKDLGPARIHPRWK